MIRVPIYDDRGQQVQACHPVVLTFSSAVPDFTLSANAKCVFQGVMRLTFVQTDLGAALHVGVQQPFDNEQGALDTTDLSQRHCKFMLSRVPGLDLGTGAWIPDTYFMVHMYTGE